MTAPPTAATSCALSELTASIWSDDMMQKNAFRCKEQKFVPVVAPEQINVNKILELR
jgi:hypothetical protein